MCKDQLKERSKELPAGAPWTTDAEFEAITVYFQPPSEEEGSMSFVTSVPKLEAGAFWRGPPLILTVRPLWALVFTGDWVPQSEA